MIKKRELHECHTLYDLMVHPDVFPFVRQKANSYDEFLFLTKQTIEAEERGELISRTIVDEWGSAIVRGELISRTIVDEWGSAIGTINLFDIQENAGFLGTWIGKPYHGKGYNKPAKDTFFHELFYELGMETIFMRIRKVNTRSLKAAQKLPYVVCANETRKALYDQLNAVEDVYDLYEIPKDLYTLHLYQTAEVQEEQALEA